MALFVLVCIDKPDSLPLRMATREAHFDYARRTGQVRLGGPFLDDAGGMAGSLIVLEADDLAAAEAWHASDPYAVAGLFEQVEIRPWRVTFGALG
jgi:uncharacterized protein YciI